MEMNANADDKNEISNNSSTAQSEEVINKIIIQKLKTYLIELKN